MNVPWITLLINFVISSYTCVRIEDNGYRGIAISFSEKTLQKSFDFEKLKVVLRNASEVLFQATRNRSYFEEFVLIVPQTESSYVCDGYAARVPDSVDVHVTDSARFLSALHSGGCGRRGDLIHVPPDWLTGDVRVLAIDFVRQWSVFRYGVFPEDAETPGSCFASTPSSWHPSGCFNVELAVEPSFDENGLPVCYFPKNFKERENLLSSIMFTSNSTKVVNYCDGSEDLPHDPSLPTLHNRICEGKSVWSVIRDTDDFLYGRNSPVSDSKTPTFRCFKESKPHVTLIVQDTDTEARSEIRYALFYFLYNIAKGDIRVSLATFSNDTLTNNTDALELLLQDEDQLKSLLLANLKLNKKVENICLVCGLRKAYKISSDSNYPLRVIVLLAPASSLSSANIVELTELIRENDGKAVLHMLILDDTGEEDIPSSLVDTMQESRGRISWIKNDRVFMFTQINTALVDASRNTLKIEDKVVVVYQKTRLNVASDFVDIFMTPKNVEGTLLYSVQCKNRGDILSQNGGCSIVSQELQSPVCESQLQLKENEESSNERKYSFEYMAGSEGSTCVSLALLKLVSSSSENLFRVRGWLNENKITPGRNALIIYAEVLGVGKDVRVEAGISGPQLADFRLDLRDNGNGDPDIKKGDNIYSRYFTSFKQKGTYMVSIYVSALTSSENSTKAEDSKRTVSQAKVVGSFRVTEDSPQEDVIPPNRVSDLKVISIDSENRTATLQWTAPGDNYDDGKAKKYFIKISRQWTNLVDIAFDQKENILLNTENLLPSNSGFSESFVIQCPVDNNNTSYFAALRATDNKNNVGKISNIIQIYFKEKSFSTQNPIEVTTRVSKDSDQTLSSTDSPAEISTSEIENWSTKDGSITFMTTTETVAGIFVEKRTIIIAASTSGAILLLLIIINLVICCYCFRKRKKQESQRKLSRNASLRPPYNLNIAYRRGSETSLDENPVSRSMNTLMDPNRGCSTYTENKYTYHTNRSLMTNKRDIPNIKNNLGFKPVQPMPAYATSSLSRFESRLNDVSLEDDQEISNTRSNGLQDHNLNNAQDTHIYALGVV